MVPAEVEPVEVVPAESPSARSSSCRRANAVPALTRSPVSGEPWRLEDSTSSAELLMQDVVTLVVGCRPPVFLGNMAYLGIQAFHQILSTPTLSLSSPSPLPLPLSLSLTHIYLTTPSPLTSHHSSYTIVASIRLQYFTDSNPFPSYYIPHGSRSINT